MSRPIASIGRRLPGGWLDALRQVGLFAGAYIVYQIVRGLVSGEQSVALSNAEHIIHFERSLGAFFEPGLQQAVINHTWLVDVANFFYLNCHFVLTTAFLVWLYLKRNDNFYFVRNMFLVAMGLALIGYGLFPTAPPRLVPNAGFVDTVGVIANTSHSSFTSFLVNAYAAVPSMHIAFALMVGVPGFVLCRTAAARMWWSAYPMLVFFVIVVTANHFWFDAAAGAAVACMAAVAATQLARLRPAAWSWREAPDQAAA